MVATENNAGECYMLPLLDVKWVMLHMEEEQFDMLSTLDVECDRLPMDEKLPDTLGSAKTTYQMMVQRLKVACARFKYCLPPPDYLEHDEAVTVRVAAGAPLPTQQLSSSPPNTIPYFPPKTVGCRHSHPSQLKPLASCAAPVDCQGPAALACCTPCSGFWAVSS